MLDRRRLWGAALGAALLASPVAAEPPRYRNFELAIYCRVDDVRRMAEGDWLETGYEALAKDLKIGKAYLETHRSRVTNDRETMLKAKRFFESRGIKTAGGITLVADEGREFRQFSYTSPADRKHVEEVACGSRRASSTSWRRRARSRSSASPTSSPPSGSPTAR